MKRIIIIAVLILALGSVLIKAKGPKRAPSCSFYNLQDEQVQLSDYKGRPIILFFWATWCPYCIQEMPTLNSVYPEILQSNIYLIGVDIKESKSTIAQFINSNQIEFDVWQDKDGGCASSFGIVGIPTYVLIDKGGKIIAKANSLPVNYKELLLK